MDRYRQILLLHNYPVYLCFGVYICVCLCIPTPSCVRSFTLSHGQVAAFDELLNPGGYAPLLSLIFVTMVTAYIATILPASVFALHLASLAWLRVFGNK